MTPELKAKWVAALRSGEYQQQREGFLYREGKGHCCLGVLAEVAGLMLKQDGRPRDAGHLCDHYDVLSESQQRVLWRMNDGFGGPTTQRTFAEIADYIEESIPCL